MKKNYFFLTLILILSFSFTTYAKEPEKIFIHSGITTEGINYQVYGTTLSVTNDSINVSRTVVFDGKVAVERTRTWTEYIDGELYSGTLYLVSSLYNRETNQTTVVYQGTLTKQA